MGLHVFHVPFHNHTSPNSVAAAGVICVSPLGKHWTLTPFSASLSASQISALEFWCIFTGSYPNAKWNNHGNLTTFWMEYQSKISHSWVISNSKASFDFKGRCIPNSMDPCGSHFPIKDLDGGDCLQPIKMDIWCLAAPWSTPSIPWSPGNMYWVTDADKAAVTWLCCSLCHLAMFVGSPAAAGQ